MRWVRGLVNAIPQIPIVATVMTAHTAQYCSLVSDATLVGGLTYPIATTNGNGDICCGAVDSVAIDVDGVIPSFIKHLED